MVRIGERKIETIGTPRSFWNDLYHSSMTTSWPNLLLALCLLTLGINGLFAILYMLDPQGVANIPPDRPWWAFYFSLETLATVGYGAMHPADEFVHFVASVEMLVGLLLTAVITGLIFARFSRPGPRFMFSKSLVVGQHEGQTCLMLRVANARHNTVADAHAKLWCLMASVNAEGVSYRRFVELKLTRRENPTFILSWTIFHVMNEESPIYGLDASAFEQADLSFVASVSGIDETVAQAVQARQIYPHAMISWNHQFADIISSHPDGHPLLDYRKFHDVVPENAVERQSDQN